MPGEPGKGLQERLDRSVPVDPNRQRRIAPGGRRDRRRALRFRRGALGRKLRKPLFDLCNLGVCLGGCRQRLGELDLGRVRLRDGLNILPASGKDAEGEGNAKPGTKPRLGHLDSVSGHAVRN